jgi:tRNA1Val (adenine37-N6)-methyltransferase
MPNSWFRFKQFRIDQDLAGMKVCTDSCILGAYATVIGPETILDIGTGTGLLALMAAQRFPNTEIHAIEYEQQHVKQAEINFRNSPFRERVKLFHSRIQDFTADKKYDLIICNPPFFNKSTKSPDRLRNVSFHSDDLPYSDLAFSIVRLLNENGKAFVLFSPPEEAEFSRYALSAGLKKNSELLIFKDEQKPLFRIISGYSFKESNLEKEEFFINREGKYSSEFISLLKDYYLIF